MPMSQLRLARLGLLLAALGLNLAPSMLGVGAAYAADQKAEEKADSVRLVIGKPLNAIAELMTAKKYAEAFAKIDEADAAADKTPYEIYSIDRARAAVATASGDRALASKSLEAVINSGRLAPAEQSAFIQTLAGNLYLDKNFPKAISWLNRLIKEGNTDPQIRSILIRAYYLNNDFAIAIKEMKGDIATLEAAGKTPEEDQIIILRNCAAKLKDKATYTLSIEKLATYYPSNDNWIELLDNLESGGNFSERLLLDIRRLRFTATEKMPENEYRQMAELAMQAVLPAEAKKVLDHGYSAGILGTGPNASVHKQLRDHATKSAADDAKTIAKGEATAYSKAKDGTGLVNVGLAYVSHGQFDKGVTLLEAGIQRGGMKQPEDAKLHLGMAYALAGNKEKAIATFKTVQGPEGLTDLARYWVLYLNRPAK